MSWFRVRSPLPSPQSAETQPIPVAHFDLSKRYDVYFSGGGEDRVYENVRFLGIRTFDAITEFSSGLVNGYLEIEAIDRLRLLIPQYGIQLMCEHGAEPAYRLLRRWNNGSDY